MLPLSANPDFKSRQDKIVNPFYDLNGDNIGNEVEIYGYDALDQSIEMVLCTEKYERLFNLNLCSPVQDILFENVNDVDDLVSNIFDQIEYWVPISIIRKDADIEYNPSEHTIKFKIPYISNDGQIYHVFNRLITK